MAYKDEEFKIRSLVINGEKEKGNYLELRIQCSKTIYIEIREYSFKYIYIY